MFPALLNIVRRKHGIPENALPELTTALLLIVAYTQWNMYGTHIILRFVILLFDRTSKCADYGS